MRKEELIKKLQELPDNCEIGTIFPDDLRVESAIEILTKKDKIMCGDEEQTIKNIEEGRENNANYICDYYLY